MIFYDTCALLNKKNLFDEPFTISSYTLVELEKIKSSVNKDEKIKEKARRLLYSLYKNEDEFCVYDREERENTPDMKIIKDAKYFFNDYRSSCREPLIFITSDYSCYFHARFILPRDIKVEYLSDFTESDGYTGFKTIAPMSTEDETDLYIKINFNDNVFGLIENEYLIVNCISGQTDCYKWKNDKYEKVPYRTVESMHFGDFKPRNVHQILALDSMSTNRITLLGGPAGSGKSALSLAYLFNQLENGKIDRIIVFCNPVAAKNAAKLGFYPGELKIKLLSSQVGNVLASKIGDMAEVDRLIDSGKLVLIPAADLRGYETPAHSGVYIMEGQNYDTVLMRMLLQRIGNDCQVIIDGDRLEQTDLDIYENDNGMKKVSKVFRGEKIFGQVDLQKIERDEIAKIAERMK